MSSNSIKIMKDQDILDQMIDLMLKPIPDNLELGSSDEVRPLYTAPVVALYNAARDVSLADFKHGDLLITSRHITFIPWNNSPEFDINNDLFHCPVEDIKACEIINDERVVIETSENSYTFQIHKRIIPNIHKLVTLLITKSKAESS